MSKYLRDEFLKNLSINEDKLNKINNVLLDIVNEINKELNIKDTNYISNALI